MLGEMLFSTNWRGLASRGETECLEDARDLLWHRSVPAESYKPYMKGKCLDFSNVYLYLPPA